MFPLGLKVRRVGLLVLEEVLDKGHIRIRHFYLVECLVAERLKPLALVNLLPLRVYSSLAIAAGVLQLKLLFLFSFVL